MITCWENCFCNSIYSSRQLSLIQDSCHITDGVECSIFLCKAFAFIILRSICCLEDNTGCLTLIHVSQVKGILQAIYRLVEGFINIIYTCDKIEFFASFGITSKICIFEFRHTVVRILTPINTTISSKETTCRFPNFGIICTQAINIMNSVCLLVCDIQSPVVEFYSTLCFSFCCLIFYFYWISRSRISNRHFCYTTLYKNCCGTLTSIFLCFCLASIYFIFINRNQSCR